jgi:phosphatidyl-myo-inositol dimannoside synthase
MRVLALITDGFGGHGGIAQFNRDLLAALTAFPGMREIVVLPRHGGVPPAPLPVGVTEDRSGLGGKLRYGAALLRRLRGDRAFDLVICTHVNLQPLAALARLLTGAPSVLVLHGVDAWRRPRGLLRPRAPAWADVIVAVSGVTLERAAGWLPPAKAETMVLPCCVDLARFRPGPPSPAVMHRLGLPDRPILLSVARLAAGELKGFDELLAIMPALRQRVPDLLWVIAGDGSDRPRLAAKAAALGQGDAVRFLGQVAEEDKVDLYRAARCCVLAGRNEGFGIVLLEAMACGVPVVASTRDGSIEAIRGGALGVAVDPTDPASLTAGVLAALQRPRGRPDGIDYFSFGQFEARVHALVRRALARTAASARTMTGSADASR